MTYNLFDYYEFYGCLIIEFSYDFISIFKFSYFYFYYYLYLLLLSLFKLRLTSCFALRITLYLIWTEPIKTVFSLIKHWEERISDVAE